MNKFIALPKFATLTQADDDPALRRFWLLGSLAFALLYSYLGLCQAFGGEYVIQDDVRQHVFWMWRFVDPELLANDLITDYFQSVAPIGYTTIYKLMVGLGINPLVFSKILPLVLDVILTVYGFFFCLEIIPIPVAGFLSTVIFNQSLWMHGDLPSATPRAFIFPLLFAFFFYLVKWPKQQWQLTAIACSIVILLEGLFYQPLVLISLALLGWRLLTWEKGFPRFSTAKSAYYITGFGWLTGILVLLPYLLFPSEFGPTISAEQAKLMPEFLDKGRSVFFVSNRWLFWLGGDSGMFHSTLTAPLTLVISLFLPLMFLKKRWFSILETTAKNREILNQILLASTSLFLMAHVVLFKLYSPNRYTIHTFKIVMAIAAAIVIVSWVDGLWNLLKKLQVIGIWRTVARSLAVVVLIVPTLLYPYFMDSFIDAEYLDFSAEAPIFEYLKTQPKDVVVAGFTKEADNIATFAARSVLVSREHARPYDVAFYTEFQQRMADLIQAQYSSDPAILQNVIGKYKADFWLISPESFNPDFLAGNDWLQQYQPEINEAIAQLRNGIQPILQGQTANCTVVQTPEIALVDTACLTLESP